MGISPDRHLLKARRRTKAELEIVDAKRNALRENTSFLQKIGTLPARIVLANQAAQLNAHLDAIDWRNGN